MHGAKIQRKTEPHKRFGDYFVSFSVLFLYSCIKSSLHKFNVEHTEDNFVHNGIEIVFLYKVVE